MNRSLAARLRAETGALHAAAEATPFMAQLLSGAMQRPAYAALLLDLLAIYGALEPALSRLAGHPAIAPLGVADLFRMRSLQADRASLGSEGGRAATPRPAAQRLADRIAAVADAHPERLAGHAYVRYLGDLSGGQMLRRIVAASPGLVGVGTAFYDFGDASAPHSLARRLRDGLDRVPAGDADAVVDEAKLAFAWHCVLFEELAAATGLAPSVPEAGATLT